MEEKINIVEILKDKPTRTKLYSPLYGEVFLSRLVGNNGIRVLCKGLDGSLGTDEKYFWKNGKFTLGGEICLFPSKEMQDWEKFSWKKGDVLINSCGLQCIFKEWASDDYTKFNGCYFDGMPNAETAKYSKLDNNTAYGYIREIENRCGGKLNLESLEIEKTQPEFKDGDIVVTDAVPSLCYSKCIFILKGDLNTNENSANSYVFYNINNNRISFDVLDTAIRCRNIRLATEEEKKQLFSALEKEGKAWDAEKKMKELKVGERVTVTLEAVEQKGCKGCFFEGVDGYCGATSLGLECVPKYRSDHKNVIFKEVEE